MKADPYRVSLIEVKIHTCITLRHRKGAFAVVECI